MPVSMAKWKWERLGRKMEDSKKCNVCGEIKPIEAFGKCKTSIDGLYGQCKKCKYERSKLWVHSKKGREIIKKARQKYWKTEKGKAARAKHNRSDAYKKSLEKHLKLPQTNYYRYKAGAARRGIEFLLTFEEFMAYWQEPCCYCGEKIDTIGLDRVDNNIGYNAHNITACCTSCNIGKGTQTAAQYINRCILVANKGGKDGSGSY